MVDGEVVAVADGAEVEVVDMEDMAAAVVGEDGDANVARPMKLGISEWILLLWKKILQPLDLKGQLNHGDVAEDTAVAGDGENNQPTITFVLNQIVYEIVKNIF